MENMDVYHYILDPSALVYGGVGKIKQWIDLTNNQLKNQRNDESNKKLYSIVFYVPLYTLRELDFLKKVFNPLISANARESIKFIDNQISCVQFDNNELNSFSDEDDDEEEEEEDDNDDNDTVSDAIKKYKEEQRRLNQSEEDYTDFESYNRMKSKKSSLSSSKVKKDSLPNLVSFILESKDSIGPDWKIASGYRRSTPLLSELPKPINGFSSKGQFNHDNRKKLVGVFGNNIPGTFNMMKSKNDDIENSYGFYDNDNNNNNNNNNGNGNSIDNESNGKAIVPIRLKYFIRSCIQKQFIENKHLPDEFKINWDIICEDATTTIWLKSFGLNVKTLNEIQKDFDNYSGGNKSKLLFDPNSGSFIDTTEQKKSNDDNNKGRNNNRNKNRNKNRNRNKNPAKNNNDNTKKTNKSENNSVITADSFASRRDGGNSGALWTP